MFQKRWMDLDILEIGSVVGPDQGAPGTPGDFESASGGPIRWAHSRSLLISRRSVAGPKNGNAKCKMTHAKCKIRLSAPLAKLLHFELCILHFLTLFTCDYLYRKDEMTMANGIVRPELVEG